MHCNRALSQDVTGAMLMFQNKEMAATMVYQTNPLEIKLYFYANPSLVSVIHMAAGHVSENAPYQPCVKI